MYKTLQTPKATSDSQCKSFSTFTELNEVVREDAEALVQQMMVGIAGFKEVDMVNVEQPIALATFDTPASALKFIRTQKKNHIIQTNKLWAAENRSKTERTRCKIVSKLKKYMIELGGFQARDVITSYKLFRVNARVSGKICRWLL